MQYPKWMPSVDDGPPATGHRPGKGTPVDDAYLAQVTAAAAAAARKGARGDFVQRGKTWQSKTKRWILRACWRLFRKALRTAWARKLLVAPFLLGTFMWFVSAIMHFIDRGWMTVLGGFGAAAPAVYWSLGGWAWVLTRRRNLRPLPQRLWTAAAYVTLTLLSTVQAGWRIGVPMPGLWFTSMIAFTVAVAWFRHRRPKAPGESLDERHEKWDQEKKVAGTTLGPIRDYASPRRWVAEVDLSACDMLVEDLAKKAPYIAKRFKTGRGNVIIDEAIVGEDSLAKLTVVLENPLFKPVDFDESWMESDEAGCLPFHGYPDGARGSFRLFKKESGTVNALFSGDIDGGKSAGMFAATIQALMTGRCYPIVGDPQGGQSLPTLVGARGIAPMKATTPEQVYHQLIKVHAGMLARSEYLQGYIWRDRFGDLRYGMPFFDQDVMASQATNPETGEHPLHWPILLYILDEAHKACQDPEFGDAIVLLLEQIIKLSRKTGIAVWLATQYPGIEELGNKMVIRQNLVTGNVVCYRNSSKTTGTMILPDHMPEPHKIPKMTPEGKPTQGMAVISCPVAGSDRPTISRTVYLERQGMWAERAEQRIHPLDDVTKAAFDAVDADVQEADLAEQVAAHQAGQAGGAAAAAPQEDVEPWKQGSVLQRCIAYLKHLETTEGFGETTTGVLAERTGSELSAVSTAMARAAKATKTRPALCHSPRKGTWSLGEKRAEDLVGAAA